MKRFICFILAICTPLSTAYAQESKSIWESIGGWLNTAAKDTSKWASQAWGDISAWSVETWDGVSAWTVQAWADSSAWVSQAWTDSSGWAAVNWDNFIVWVNRISSANPYSWIPNQISDYGLVAFTRYCSLRSFLKSDPSLELLRREYDAMFADLSLLNEDKRILMSTLEQWSKEKGVAVENTAKLALPFVTRLLVEGESAIGGEAFTGPMVAQYLLTILETMGLEPNQNVDMRLKILRAELDDLVRPVIIGDSRQNLLVTEDRKIVENFTYAEGKYQLILVASLADKSSQFPSIRGESIEQTTKKYFAHAELGTATAVNVNNKYQAQKLPFSFSLSNTAIIGEAVALWTEKNNFLLYILTDQEWKDQEVSAWYNSIAISNDNTISLEADLESDGAFYGINQSAQRYTINRIFDEAKFATPLVGHGWAAERGNNLIDNIKGLVMGHHATVIGDNNIANGPDRRTVYSNGSVQLIQSKYHNSASQSIASSFDSGRYRYYDAANKPMAIEVPSDQYLEAITYMKRRIANGEVPGVSDVNKASEIVKKGNLTFQQAKHIAKAGTVESILYDSAHACVTAASAMGISTAIGFAVNLWNGNSYETALKESIMQGLETGGISFIVSVLSSQVAKSGLNTAMIPASKIITNAMGPKVSSLIVNAFRPSGSAIHGAAAMKSAAKLLRGTTITSAITFVVLSAGDVSDIIRGRISWKQIAKNASKTAIGITGGTLGYIGGAAIGTAILPGAGTVLVSIIVSTAAGWGANEGAKALTDLIADDDANEMIRIIEQQFSSIALEYFLNEDELSQSIQNLQGLLTPDMLKRMYQYRSREVFARQLIEMAIDPVVAKRAYIELPSQEEYASYLTEALNDIYEDVSGETNGK